MFTRRIICKRLNPFLLKLFIFANFSIIILKILKLRNGNADILSVCNKTLPLTIKPANTETRGSKWLLIDNTFIDEDLGLILERWTEWNLLVMKADETRRTIRCKTCLGYKHMDGVIEAIKNNAKFIYYAGDILSLGTELQKLKLNGMDFYLQFNGSASKYNHVHHFVSPNSTHSREKLISHYSLGGWNTPLIQTFLSSESLLKIKGKFDIDVRVPAITLSRNCYQPFPQRTTLYMYDAFWAMAPIYPSDKVVWSVMIQRLLQELNSLVLFNAPSRKNVTRNIHERLILKTDKELIERINGWFCDHDALFLQCVRSLNDFLVSTGHLSKPSSNSIHQFMDQLSAVGYEEPSRFKHEASAFPLPPINRLLFWPRFKEQSNKNDIMHSFSKTCKSGFGKCISRAKKEIPVYDNILLVVVFNRPGHYGVIEYLDSMYRPFFPQILYCGFDMDNFLRAYKGLNRQVSFLEVDFNKGQYGYECVQKAMQMNYDVDGYIHLSDDVLLNVWNVADLPKDKLWFQKDIFQADLDTDNVRDVWKHDNWGPWHSPFGQNAAKHAFQEFHNLAASNQKARSFLGMLAANTGGSNRVFYQASDIYYIPQRLAESFIHAASIFDTHCVHLEIAVPTMMNGIDRKDNIVFMNGTYLWFHERKLYDTKFNYDHVYMHSLKLDPCMADKKCTTFICSRYLPCLL